MLEQFDTVLVTLTQISLGIPLAGMLFASLLEVADKPGSCYAVQSTDPVNRVNR